MIKPSEDHLKDLRDLSGHARTEYLETVERAHGLAYRKALAREDISRREAFESNPGVAG